MSKATRTEKEIFEELESLCSSPGYVHAIAYFCFRDNTIKYADQMSVEDVLEQFSMERLIRTEISTIIGLACKSKLDIKHPGPEKLQEHIDKTDLLLQEIHTAMMPPPEMFDKDKLDDPDFNPFRNGKFLRESIFYGGESAYDFQYRDLSLVKYKNDNDWFLEKKGYSIEQAGLLLTVLRQLQNDKINNFIPSLATKHPSEWTVLPSFIFSIEELSKKSSIDIETVNCFVISFVAPEEIDNSGFQELSDFNLLNAYPIIRLNEKEFLLFQNYSKTNLF